MNRLKITGLGLVAVGKITTQDWILIISILVTVLGMIQDYLQRKEAAPVE